jgi:N-acetyl-anhydromuramyl-L-alanine amidase AmpD
MDIEFLGSPNFTSGRDGHDLVTEPRYLVIHAMGQSIAGADARFRQAAQAASAHYGVGLDGRIVQWVREADAAWHAGLTIDLDSIGIGLAGGPPTEAQYRASADLVRDICQRYGMPIDRRHVRPHRASGPNALDVDRIIREAERRH